MFRLKTTFFARFSLELLIDSLAQNIMFEPFLIPLHLGFPVLVLAQSVAFTRIDDELDRHIQVMLEGTIKTLCMTGWYALIIFTYVDQCWCLYLVCMGQ